MTKHLTDLSARLAELAALYPDGIPPELVEIEVTRVNALIEMVGQGLVD